jgi:Stress responsive A/B Barrel Domain
MSIQHAVLFRFVEDVDDERVAALAAGLDTMPVATGAVAPDRYRHGRTLKLHPESWDYAVVAEFDSVEAYATYRDHPEHRALVRDLLRPIITERAAMQFELPG